MLAHILVLYIPSWNLNIPQKVGSGIGMVVLYIPSWNLNLAYVFFAN